MNWIGLVILGVVLAGLYALKRSSLVPVDTAAKLLREGALVVDVRTPQEYAEGHLPGAVNVPLGEIAEDIRRHAPDPKRVLLLHCVSGGRSGLAARRLRGLGYTQAHNLGSYSRAEQLVSTR